MHLRWFNLAIQELQASLWNAWSKERLLRMGVSMSWPHVRSFYATRASKTFQAGPLCEMESGPPLYRRPMTPWTAHRVGSISRLRHLKNPKGRECYDPCASPRGLCCGLRPALAQLPLWKLPRLLAHARFHPKACKRGSDVASDGPFRSPTPRALAALQLMPLVTISARA